MTDIYMNALREFHKKYNHYISEVPHVPPGNVIQLRKILIDEEAQEHSDISSKLIDGPYANNRNEMIDDVVLVADALADILYVTFGTALAYGIDIKKVFLEVHRSNMTKSMEKDTHHKLGKTIKGPDYEPPNIAQFIDIPSFEEEY